jgi:hypothetical protein
MGNYILGGDGSLIDVIFRYLKYKTSKPFVNIAGAPAKNVSKTTVSLLYRPAPWAVSASSYSQPG